MKNRLWYWPTLALLIVGTVFILRKHSANNAYTTHHGGIFGTVYNITFQGTPTLIDSCLCALQEVDASLSMFNPESILSRINRGEDVEPNDMTREVLTLAVEVSRATDGAFDITVAPLVNAWGFGYKSGTLPDSAAVDSLMQHVGWQHIELADDGRITLSDTLMRLDCSAIAKGYGCDVVARTLREHGVKNYLIEIGGEVVTSGVNAKGKPWHVGVSTPNEDPAKQDVMEVIEMSDGAMATSGNYRNFRIEEDGRKIAHTIDPHTGYPVQHSLLSATVFAPTCAMADAYATSFMVLGLDEARRILEQHSELRAYLIYDEAGELKVWQNKQ